MFLLPRAYYSPGIRFKTTLAILAVVQCLLSYNTCRGFLLLRSDIFSWLLHLPGNIELAGSKSQGMPVLTGEAHFRHCYSINRILLFTLAREFYFRWCFKPNLTRYTCRGVFLSFTCTDQGFQ